MLPQVPDNEANGRLGLARRVKTFMLFCQNEPGTKCHRKNSTQTGFKALNIFKNMDLHKNFHEMFGIVLPEGGRSFIDPNLPCKMAGNEMPGFNFLQHRYLFSAYMVGIQASAVENTAGGKFNGSGNLAF